MRIVKAGLVIVLMSGCLAAQEKSNPRVFITESRSFTIRAYRGNVIGGDRPQTAEITKTFNKRCSNCTITKDEKKADYVVLLEHEGGKSHIRRDNKFVLYNEDGDVIKSGSTRSLGNAVKDVCAALMKDWQSRTTDNE
ncbi:MAG: hypothetical protein L0229_09940 [Blastocatellia bacterium]|nr:hypothetical protein [Blastocatellia bacterium]